MQYVTFQCGEFNVQFFFNIHGTVHRQMCILYNQQDATYKMFFIIIRALHVLGGKTAQNM